MPSIANMTFWIDADNLSTLFQDSAKTTPVTANNDVVGAWADGSAGGFDVLQATTAKKPLYKTSVQNGLAGIYADGSDDYLVAASSFSGFTAATGFIVWQPARATNTQGPAWETNGNDATPSVWPYTGGAVYDRFFATNRPNVATGIAANTTYLTHMTANATTLAWYVNGVSTYSGAAGGFGLGFPITIFDVANAGTRYFKGYVLEGCIFSRILSAGEISLMLTYLNGKWAVY